MACGVRKNRGSSGCPLDGRELLGLPVTVTASYLEVECNPMVRWLEVYLSRKLAQGICFQILNFAPATNYLGHHRFW
jgi:hypothetical protein